MHSIIDIPHRDGSQISHAIRAKGDLVFLAGQTGYNYETDQWVEGVAGQTELALNAMKEALECAGATLSDVVRTQVFLADWTTKDEFHEVFHRFFPKNPPVRSRYEVTLLAPECLVQIDAIAVVNS